MICGRKWLIALYLFFAGLLVLGMSGMAVAEPAIEKPVKAEPLENKIEHIAVGAKVTVSSTHIGEKGEGASEALVDGDLNTRWSSDYSAPQEIVVDLGAPVVLRKLRLHWEKASATKYSVTASLDGKEWTNIHLLYMQMRGEPEGRVDNINAKDLTTRYLRFTLLSCVNKEWGFSLYEIEVEGREQGAEGKEQGAEGKEQGAGSGGQGAGSRE